MPPAFGLNRSDSRTPRHFAVDAKRTEDLGFEHQFLPTNPTGMPEPYVMMAAGAAATSRLGFGLLLENPVLSHPAVTAGAISTVAELSGGRVILCYGAGDTAVRFLGRKPATVAELERATVLVRRLVAGERIDFGGKRPVRIQHAYPAPVWVAAGGPKTMRMAGRVADGVFLRVGRHPKNLQASIAAVHAGAAEAGRDPAQVKLGLIFHWITSDDPEAVRLSSRSLAAGYYEYTPALFDQAGLAWDGPPVHELQQQVWPDFHHAPDLTVSGKVVEFLSEDAAQAFALFGSAADIAAQLRAALAACPPIDIVVPHPVPNPPLPSAPIGRASTVPGADWKTWLARDLRPLL